MGLIELISPKWAYKRQAWREAYKIQRQRNYDAGSDDRHNRNWLAFNESAEQTDKYYRNTVRARSRDLERNSDLMLANIFPWIRNVVGKGYELEVKTDSDETNKAIEELWRAWCKKDNCDVTGSQSLWEMARMAVRRKRVDGGILFIKCYTPGGIIPFKLQAIEVDELDETQMKPHNEGHKVIGGIEYDSYNRAVGYWIKEYDIEGYLKPNSHYVSRENVIFYFSKTRPSQIREMPEMSATIGRIKEVNGYIDAASIKERVAACLSVFIKKVMPSGGALGRAPEGTKKTSYNELELTPGLVTELNAGDEIDVVNPGASATNGGDFIKDMKMLIAAGQGVSYEAASRDLQHASYSSARQAMIEDEETFAVEEQKLQDDFLDEVYTAFVTNAVLSGAIQCPRFWENPNLYYAHSWLRKPKKWIDPQKEANANKIALETGQRLLSDIWYESGRDYREVMDKMKEMQNYADEIGLNINLPYLTGGNNNVNNG